MHHWKRSIVGIVMSGMSLGLAAAPHDPNIQIQSITSFPEAVTLRSDRYDTRVSYRVVLKNNTTNVLNRTFYKGTITVDGSIDTDASIEGVFPESGAAVSCTLSGTSVDCVVGAGGSLPPGIGAAFWITAKAPFAGSTMTLNTTFGGDEGKGGGNGCCDSVATTNTTLVDALISPSVKTNARSFIPGTGGLIFTGLGSNQDPPATSDDPWVTLVTLPPFTVGLSVDGGVTTLPFTTATLTESSVSASCAPYALAQGCFASDLAIPGSFDSLRVVIRWDSSKIKPGTKPENVKLFYTHDPNVAPVQVQLCSVAGGPAPGQPCLESVPIRYTKQAYPLLPRGFWGDIEFRVLARDNGRYTN